MTPPMMPPEPEEDEALGVEASLLLELPPPLVPLVPVLPPPPVVLVLPPPPVVLELPPPPAVLVLATPAPKR